MYNTSLITIAVIAILILTVWYIWRVIFLRSWRKLFFVMLGAFLESTKGVDVDMDIEPSKTPRKSEGMKAQAQTLDFDNALEKSRPPLPQQANIPLTETGEFARDTSYNGWPRELDDDTRRDTRPFRAVHLNTENDDIQTLSPNNDSDGQTLSPDNPAT